MDASILHTLGKGDSIMFWSHDWGTGILRHQFAILYTFVLEENVSVADALSVADLQTLFKPNLSQEAVTQLLQLHQVLQETHTQLTEEPDKAIWRRNSQGQFTVRSLYHFIKNRPTVQTHVHRIWKIVAPPRMQVFAWLMTQNKILTIDNLMKRGWTMVNRCVMCKSATETVLHLFEECRMTVGIYNRITTTMGYTMPANEAKEALTRNILTKDQKSVLLITQFVIWRERCLRTFTDKSHNDAQLLQQIESQWALTRMTKQTTLT